MHHGANVNWHLPGKDQHRYPAAPQVPVSGGDAIGQDPADRRGAQPGLLRDQPVALASVGQIQDVGGLLRLVAALAAELDAAGLCPLTSLGGPLHDQVALDLGGGSQDPDDQLCHLAQREGVDPAVEGADVAATVQQLSDPADGFFHRPAQPVELRQDQDVAGLQCSQGGLEL